MLDFKEGDTIGTFSEEEPNYPIKGFFMHKSIWGYHEPHSSYLLVDNNGKCHKIIIGIDYLNTRIHNVRMVLIEKCII